MRLPLRFTSTSVGAGLLLAAIIGAPAAVAGVGDPIDHNDRASVVSAYQQWLLPQLIVPVGWTGSVAGCDPGSTSEANQQATLNAINYVRAMSGVPPVSWRADLASPAQAAALVMTANGRLSHTPNRDWTCWTPAAAKGAANSNIGLTLGGTDDGLAGTTGARVVMLYMTDMGESNISVGHRRWLQYPRLREVGSGDTNAANAIYVMSDQLGPRTKPSYVSWPTAGFFPRELEPEGRWSVSYPGADFSKATMTVTGPQGPWATRRLPVTQGMGDNAMVWHVEVPPGLQADPATDVPITVTVSGLRMKGKRVKPVRWTTTFVKAS